MAQNAALASGMSGARVRVRTPGKYILLFLYFPVVIVAVGSGLWLNMVEQRAVLAALEYRMSVSGEKEAYFALPEFLVDLAPDRNGRTAYLKMKVSLALRGEGAKKTAEQIDAVKPGVIERMTFFLRELRPEDFEGSEGMARVKREMLRRVNLVIAPAEADEVVVEELVIQ